MTTIQDGVEFVDTLGKMPPLWQRRVTFFANLLALFFGNEEQTAALRDEVGEIDSYGGRLIPILNLLFQGGENLLVLEGPPNEIHCRYLEDDLGLTLPRMEVMKHDRYVEIHEHLKSGRKADATSLLKSISEYETEWLDGYVTDETLTHIASHLGRRTITTTSASMDGNNKLLLYNFLVEQGLPTFGTMVAESSADLPACARELTKQGYNSVVVRAQIGASGIGMSHIREPNNPDRFTQIPDYFFYEGPCLVQGWLEPGIFGVDFIRSPSTQLFVDETHVYAFDFTEQILCHESVHQGNESPPPYLPEFPHLREEMMQQAKVVGNWLHGTGYRGTASIDWLLVHREGKKDPDVYVCEINARVTGATYPSLLARHFNPEGAWLLRNLRLRTPTPTIELFEMFAKPRHLFHREQSWGVLPLNLNYGKDGLVHKGQFLCFGKTIEECHKYLDLAEHDLPIDWDADRD
ncbi:MAG: hypothetical protein Tsb009_38440 [Planctomycetaceae bacterium]